MKDDESLFHARQSVNILNKETDYMESHYNQHARIYILNE